MHFDVMDGVFVPQITAGPGFVAALGAQMLRDVHLMVADPAGDLHGARPHLVRPGPALRRSGDRTCLTT